MDNKDLEYFKIIVRNPIIQWHSIDQQTALFTIEFTSDMLLEMQRIKRNPNKQEQAITVPNILN